MFSFILVTQSFQLCSDTSNNLNISNGDVLALKIDSNVASSNVAKCRCMLEVDQPIVLKPNKLIFKESTYICRYNHKSWGYKTTCGLDEPSVYRGQISVINQEDWTLRINERSRYYGSYLNTVRGLIFLHYVADQGD